ncbi:type II toxin-antitoxin system ParD family antitoxin [Aureimonas glaciei]|uniref:Antitoxin n=1 Tax=Aureimonas glaciei TaxID=1776957 RepID=A0A916XSE2_9HYPH|nr:type II toxin-antitoxin system ParD family antitoxin [Aureimonas glaciei]GGD02883.1 antitoxin [Aureimonas glaciei]
MSKTTSVTLDDHFADFVASSVDQGRYASVSEVVQAGLELLERESKRQALRTALIEAEESGPSVPFDRRTFLAEMHAKYGL